MLRIAISMLVNDPARYAGIVLGLVFTSFMMGQQPGMFFGILSRTTSLIDDVAIADVWVMDANVQFVDDAKPLSDTQLYRVKSIEGVAWAVPFHKGSARVRLPDGNFQTCNLYGLDDASLIGGPARMAVGSVADLRKSDGVLVDQANAGAGGRLALVANGGRAPLSVGSTLEISDRRAVVVGLHRGTPGFQSTPTLYTTYARARQFNSQERKLLSFVLVKLQPGADPARVTADIRRATGLAAYTREAFRTKSRDYFLWNTGIVVNFGLSALIGFVIGGSIAAQSFASFTRDNLRYFGVLKAMGASRGQLLAMILAQALFIALVGFGIGIGLVALFASAISGAVLAITITPLLLGVSAGAVLAVVTFSAVLSIRRVLHLEPAAVFRG